MTVRALDVGKFQTKDGLRRIEVGWTPEGNLLVILYQKDDIVASLSFDLETARGLQQVINQLVKPELTLDFSIDSKVAL